MRKIIILTIILIIGLFCLTGCDSKNKEENKNGYYTYIPVIYGKYVGVIPVYHDRGVNYE